MSCYNESVYDDDMRSDVEAAFLNGYFEETEIAGDRHMIEFIKSIMAQERDVKSDMIEVLKEQILVLRQELYYKQSVIDALLRNYEPPCVHNNLSTHQDGNASSFIQSLNNPASHNNSKINCEHMNGHSNSVNNNNKPVITLYSSHHSPAPSPFAANLVNSHSNHHHNNNKMNDPLIKSLISDNPISSFVTKTVEKFEGSMQTCAQTSVLPANMAADKRSVVNNNECNIKNGIATEIEIIRTSTPLIPTSPTDLTQWKYKTSPPPLPPPISNQNQSRIPTSQSNHSDSNPSSPKKEFVKPLSETLINVRNLLKSNIPRPQKENKFSPRREDTPAMKKDAIQNKLNRLNGHDITKDVISTHKTFRVKFKKDGSLVN